MGKHRSAEGVIGPEFRGEADSCGGSTSAWLVSWGEPGHRQDECVCLDEGKARKRVQTFAAQLDILDGRLTDLHYRRRGLWARASRLPCHS